MRRFSGTRPDPLLYLWTDSWAWTTSLVLSPLSGVRLPVTALALCIAGQQSRLWPSSFLGGRGKYHLTPSLYDKAYLSAGLGLSPRGVSKKPTLFAETTREQRRAPLPPTVSLPSQSFALSNLRPNWPSIARSVGDSGGRSRKFGRGNSSHCWSGWRVFPRAFWQPRTASGGCQ
jgi:hypothetical protein